RSDAAAAGGGEYSVPKLTQTWPDRLGKLKLVAPEEGLVAKFIHRLMGRGKKATARRVFLNTLTQIARSRQWLDPAPVAFRAIENVKPPIEIKARRQGHTVYHVPMLAQPARQEMLAIRWILRPLERGERAPCTLTLRTKSWPRMT